ncbi:oxidoreductase [Cellulomonas fimi]|uniref:Short-chain dehydrogenase/reductase SDR n=1 Tax=Cellulomonas fimi (strain ATCC 484 / DSM 20113 / JCM 1341 / CCUG 24087 / LMG 16345 / NBRC 15513 / NCIMB 8980 / NCTC 7547 / NRS-133) TaxID=590998 RepID=F4H3I7_CELFA|nr:oxidoreductase [Cellulomonas fimi]AEE46532.1 short-chain dehydrogenase/reductase SDR [Cellulomonas fimi ATCC 484]NNH08740.1 SDR family NAD(P)-dependent oxidoreductase [Cellulomonas fimi]VEH33375.1 Fatty acyl-CoA reductase [Cellulomonas fimi]
MSAAWSTRHVDRLVPDLSGRVAVVTGANGGLGRATARVLGAHGAHVVLAARDVSRADAARDAILAEHPGASLATVRLDLASLASVRDAAAGILADHPRVDLLVNNAGVMATPFRTTEDGFELQLGVNHLGHWALTALLVPALLRAPAARVVSVTSTAHHGGAVLDPDDLLWADHYDPWRAYYRSKLANFHFALGLQRAFAAAGAPAASLLAHPGLARTGLQETTVANGGGGRSAGFWLAMVHRFGMSAEGGAVPQLRAATDPHARGGELYAPRWVNVGPAVRRPVLRRDVDAGVRTLWRVSEDLTGLPMPV